MDKKIFQSLAKPLISVVLSLIAAAGLIAALGSMQNPASVRASGAAQHCVQKGDSIQAAILAADPGDVIAIETDIFTESIWISKSLTLSGGWEEDCSVQPLTRTTLINANYLGRAIRIEPSDPNDELEVHLEHISMIKGDASGLGGANEQDPPSFPELEEWVEGNTFTPTATSLKSIALDGEVALRTLRDQNLLPGGAKTFASLNGRIEDLQTSNWLQPVGEVPAPASATQPQTPHADVDCGGGIYASHTSLNLTDVTVMKSIASQTGPGYGGALCVVNIPENGSITIGELSQFKDNYASLNHEGIGGGAYFDGGNETNVITAPVTIDDDVTFWRNAASNSLRGYGGNLAAYNLGGLSAGKAAFAWGLGGHANDLSNPDAGISYGGGIFLQNCPDAKFAGTLLSNNLADSGGITGYGGGIAILKSNNVEISDDAFFGRNTAEAQLGLYGPFGHGGAVAILESQNVHIHDTLMEFNLGSLYSQGYGGAIFSFGSNDLLIEDNRFFDNMAAVYPNGNLFGGAISLLKLSGARIRENEFSRNALGLLNQADFMGVGPGGGAVGMSDAEDILIVSNKFNENTGMFSGWGHGAGINVSGQSTNVEIAHNEFHKNVAVRNATASGVRSFAHGAAILIDVASEVNIHHNLMENNAASTTEQSLGAVVYISGFIPGSDSLGTKNVTVNANRILNSGYGLAPEVTYDTGGIDVYMSEYTTITNNIIANTSYFGVMLSYFDNPHGQSSQAKLINNTLVNNGLLGIGVANNWSQDCLTVTNNIVMSHTTGMLSDSYNVVTVDHNLFFANSVDVSGTLTTTASVFADPLLVNPGLLDYHIKFISPARDAGAGIPPAPYWDADGRRRPFGWAVDIGAYEALGWFFPLIMN